MFDSISSSSSSSEATGAGKNKPHPRLKTKNTSAPSPTLFSSSIPLQQPRSVSTSSEPLSPSSPSCSSSTSTPSSTSTTTTNFWEEEIIKQGPVWKKGGGESLFGRKNWKLRWFILWRSQLCYYKSDPCWRKPTPLPTTTTISTSTSASITTTTATGQIGGSITTNPTNLNPSQPPTPQNSAAAPLLNRLLKKRSTGALSHSSSSSSSSSSQHRRTPSASVRPKEISSALASSSSSSSGSPSLSSLASGAEAAAAAQLHAVSQPLGQIQLQDLIGVQPVHEGTSRSETDFCFKVVTPHRTYFFATKDYGVTAEWITELRQLMFEFQSQKPGRFRTGSLLQPAKSLDNIFTSFENSPKICRSAAAGDSFGSSSPSSSSPPSSPILSRRTTNSPSTPRRGTISVTMLPIFGGTGGAGRGRTSSTPPTPRREQSHPTEPQDNFTSHQSSKPININTNNNSYSLLERNVSLGDIISGTSSNSPSPPQSRFLSKPSLNPSFKERSPKLGRSPAGESALSWEPPISSLDRLLTDSSRVLDLIEF